MNKEIEEVNLIEIVKKMFRYLIPVLIFTAVITFAAYYYTTNRITPTYKASATLLVGKESDSDIALTYTDVQVGKQLLEDYRELIMTDIVVEQVINDLSLELSPVTFRNNLSISVAGESRFMIISYISTDQNKAAEICNKVADVLIEKSIEILFENNTQIIDYAKVPSDPDGPNLFMNVAVAFIFGIIFSLFLVLLRIMTSSKYHDDPDVEKSTGSFVLGVIPKFKHGLFAKKTINLLSPFDQTSLLYESYRMFRTNLDYKCLDQKLKIIMFASASSEEGKVVSIINTATSYAKSGKKVLLIECDLSNQRLYKLLKVNQYPGMTNYMLDGKNLLETIQKVPGITNMRFMGSGKLGNNQINLFSLLSFSNLLADAKRKYDIVLINTPPILCMTDAVIISKKVDAVVLIIEQRKTKKEIVEKALISLSKIDSNIDGILINK